MKRIALLLLPLLFAACKEDIPTNSAEQIAQCDSEVVRNNKVYTKDGRTFLWAGHDTTSHFDITNWGLSICQLHDYGYKRESYAALTDPKYFPVSEVPESYKPTEKVIVVHGDNDLTKIYPYTLMNFHEVINDVVDGEPIMIAYCGLADLAAVYTRILCDGKEFTFAVSGYTYSDENIWGGLKGFVLWDRETESLWWPLIDVAVSGPMQNNSLVKHTESKWAYSTWQEVKNNWPEALVLSTDNDWVPPTAWRNYPCGELNCCNN